MTRTAAIILSLFLLTALTGGLIALAGSGGDPPTELYVRTVPAGAKVFIDGKKVGVSDGLFEVRPGTRNVKVELSGYEPAVKKAIVPESRIERVIFELEKKAASVDKSEVAMPEVPPTPGNTACQATLERAQNHYAALVKAYKSKDWKSVDHHANEMSDLIRDEIMVGFKLDQIRKLLKKRKPGEDNRALTRVLKQAERIHKDLESICKSKAEMDRLQTLLQSVEDYGDELHDSIRDGKIDQAPVRYAALAKAWEAVARESFTKQGGQKQRERHFVRLVLGKDRMTFEGKDTTWDELPELLRKVPNKERTVLEIAVTSDDIGDEKKNKTIAKASLLARQVGLEYLSDIGVHPLGSKGSASEGVKGFPKEAKSDARYLRATDEELNRRKIGKKVADFPEKRDLSTPESAWAAYTRASGKRDAKGVAASSWVKIDPAEMEQFWKEGEPDDMAVYNKAPLDSECIEVVTLPENVAAVISRLAFPGGKDQYPYRVRFFGRHSGEWKSLGEDCCPTLEAARENVRRKIKAAFSRFERMGVELTTEDTAREKSKAEDSDTPKNLLKNPGAESGDKTPDAWEQGANIPGVTYSWDKNVAHTGKASLCIEKTAQGYFPIAEWSSRVIERTGDAKTMELSAYVKAEKMTKAVLDVLFLDEDGEWLSHEWAAYIGAKKSGDPPADHDWKKYSGFVKIPPRAAKYRVRLQVYGPGKVWFDNIQLQSPAPEKVFPFSAVTVKAERTPPGDVKVGETVKYSVRLTNNSKPPVTDIKVALGPDANFTMLRATEGFTIHDSGALTWMIPALRAEKAETLELEIRATTPADQASVHISAGTDDGLAFVREDHFRIVEPGDEGRTEKPLRDIRETETAPAASKEAPQRMAILPDANAPGAKGSKVVLDLASGEMLEASKEGGPEAFTKLGKGDLLFGVDRFIGCGCLRGAKAQRWDGKRFVEMKPKTTRGDSSLYEIPAVPCRLLITTAEGKQFDVAFLSIDKKKGLMLTYHESRLNDEFSLKDDSIEIQVTPTADISVGDTVRFKVSLTNHSKKAMRNLHVTLKPDANLFMLNATPGFKFSAAADGPLSWDKAAVDVGKTARWELEARATAATDRASFKVVAWTDEGHVIAREKCFRIAESADGKSVKPPIRDVSAEELIKLVEDFFRDSRDVTARETLEWGSIRICSNGNRSIRYMYLATISGKKQLMNQVFTFDANGKYVKHENVQGFPKNVANDDGPEEEPSVKSDDRPASKKKPAPTAAPRPVKITPEIGAIDVDPSVKEIRVTFDRDMDTEGMSWCGAGEHFPKIDGEAKWIDKRTCVLPVKLEKGKAYRVALNWEKYRNFQSADGVPVTPTAVYFCTKGASPGLVAQMTPPKVVNATLEDGAKDVPSGKTTVSVTFDQPMDAGMSWCRNGLKSVGEPVWSEDKKTWSFTAVLEPDRDYRVRLNPPPYGNFMNEVGVSLEPVVWEFSTLAAPRPIKIIPEIGATDVDPSLKEIRVTFDRDMETDCMSWCGAGEHFPKIDGEAKWIDKRTCVLPVKLEKGKAYRLALNWGEHQGFHSTASLPVTPTPIYFCTKGAGPELVAQMKAPKVVKLSIDKGARNVPPGRTKLSVTFDQPMGDGMSWCNGKDTPKLEPVDGSAWSKDKKTCSMTAVLEPGHDYAIYLNSEYHGNFMNEVGVSLEPVIWRFSTGE